MGEILLEDGTPILLEDGTSLLLEDGDTNGSTSTLGTQYINARIGTFVDIDNDPAEVDPWQGMVIA